MGLDVGLSEVDRIEVIFEEVNNEDITVELVDNPATIELETSPEIQVAVNEIYSDVNVILDHDKQINRNLNKQHTSDTIQESASKRFTSDLEINSKANQSTLDAHINDLDNPHETDISNLKGYPTVPTLNRFLRDDKTFSEVAIGSGGYNANVYFTSINSDIATYKKISYSLEIVETILTTTATNESKLINTYLYDSGVGITNLDEGAWDFYTTCKIDVVDNSNRIKAVLFKRSSLGVESDLFTSYSNELINIDYLQIRFQNIQSNIPVLATDRIGVRLYFETTNINPVNLSLITGNGKASYFTTPLALRHSQLRLPNEDLNTQHLTDAQKNLGALATGVPAFPTVKDGISRIDRLLVDYAVPSNTTSLTFDRDKNGVLFSSIGLKFIRVQYFIKTVNPVSTTAVLRINDIDVGYKQAGGTTSGVLYRVGKEAAGSIIICSIGDKLTFESKSESSNTELNDATTLTSNFYGHNRGVFSGINKIVLFASGETFTTDSYIKIYRND